MKKDMSIKEPEELDPLDNGLDLKATNSDKSRKSHEEEKAGSQLEQKAEFEFPQSTKNKALENPFKSKQKMCQNTKYELKIQLKKMDVMVTEFSKFQIQIMNFDQEDQAPFKSKRYTVPIQGVTKSPVNAFVEFVNDVFCKEQILTRYFNPKGNLMPFVQKNLQINFICNDEIVST